MPIGLRRVDVLAEDRELVAAEARDRVAGAQLAVQARADRAQQLVAGVVAERVVDDLQVVEVQEQQRDPAAVARARGRAPGAGGRAAARGWAGR